MLGTVVWQAYLGVGGDSDTPAVRQRAADVVIRTFMEMLLNVPDDSSTAVTHAVSLAQGLIDADLALTGGLHSKVIDGAAVSRGLWPARTVDLWIADSPTDAGAIPSPVPHWTSPDLWVRNLGPADGDDPSGGHQEPIIGQPNYLYVTVRNRGTAASAAGDVLGRGVPLRPGHRDDLADALHVDGDPDDRAVDPRRRRRCGSGRSCGPPPCSATSASSRSSTERATRP